jgi:hypothetical protein
MDALPQDVKDYIGRLVHSYNYLEYDADIGIVTIHWEWLGHPNLDLLFNQIYKHDTIELLSINVSREECPEWFWEFLPIWLHGIPTHKVALMYW